MTIPRPLVNRAVKRRVAGNASVRRIGIFRHRIGQALREQRGSVRRDSRQLGLIWTALRLTPNQQLTDRGSVGMVGKAGQPISQFRYGGAIERAQVSLCKDMPQQGIVVDTVAFADGLGQTAAVLQGEYPADEDRVAGRERMRQGYPASATRRVARQCHRGFVAISRFERLCVRNRSHGSGK